MSLDIQKLKFLQKKEKTTISKLIKHPCYDTLKLSPPIILEPIKDKIYKFSPLIPKEYRTLKISCEAFNENEKLVLYLNGKEIKNSSFINFDEGLYELVCYESHDKFDVVKFRVKVE